MEERDILASRFRSLYRHMTSNTRSIAQINARAIEDTAAVETMEVDYLHALNQANGEIRTEMEARLRPLEEKARLALIPLTIPKTNNAETMVMLLVGLVVVMGAGIIVAKLA